MPAEHKCALHTIELPNFDSIVWQASDNLVVVTLQAVESPAVLIANYDLGERVMAISPVLFHVLNIPRDAWIKPSKILVVDAVRW